MSDGEGMYSWQLCGAAFTGKFLSLEQYTFQLKQKYISGEDMHSRDTSVHSSYRFQITLWDFHMFHPQVYS